MSLVRYIGTYNNNIMISHLKLPVRLLLPRYIRIYYIVTAIDKAYAAGFVRGRVCISKKNYKFSRRMKYCSQNGNHGDIYNVMENIE